ncbi:hypothetical protein Tco_0667460 [Tanacetum coccineum]
MSDSEHSTVTYTSVPEDDSDIGSPGVEGPIFQDPPSPDYVPGPEGPPSPDYVPGPEEPEQAPPSPIYIPFVPEPVYPEFLPVDDEVFPAEEQPLPAADSPTHQSPGYIPESDPEEDLEEDDEEDPEEDPADYPADRGDDDDDDAEEEEHLAPADPTAAPTPFLSEEVAGEIYPFRIPISSPPPISPTYVEGSMGSRAAGIRQRDALPVHETEMPEMCLTTCSEEAVSYYFYPDRERGEVVSGKICIGELDDARNRALLRARVNMLTGIGHPQTHCPSDRGRRPDYLVPLGHGRWMPVIRYILRAYRCGLRSMARRRITDLQAAARRGSELKAQMIELQRQQGPAKDPAEPELPEEAATLFRSFVQYRTLYSLLILPSISPAKNGDQDQAPQEHEVKASHHNSPTSPQYYYHTSVTSGPSAAMHHEVSLLCLAATSTTQMAMIAMTSGTVREVNNDLSGVHLSRLHEMSTLILQGPDNQRFQELALLSDRMFPEETDKIERYVGGMPDSIYSSVVASKPKTI